MYFPDNIFYVKCFEEIERVKNFVGEAYVVCAYIIYLDETAIDMKQIDVGLSINNSVQVEDRIKLT